MIEYSPAKTGEYQRIFPNFQKYVCCEKYLKDNKQNSLHFTLKICLDICPWTLSVPKAYSFPLATLLGNSSLLGTDDVRGQISKDMFAPVEATVYMTLK